MKSYCSIELKKNYLTIKFLINAMKIWYNISTYGSCFHLDMKKTKTLWIIELYVRNIPLENVTLSLYNVMLYDVIK